MLHGPRTAFVFPGQGSQAVGMGREIAEQFRVAAHTFQEADDALGMAISRLCFEGPADDLNQTRNTQPAIYVCSIAVWRALQGEYPHLTPFCTAGHSLGEITALTVSGALTFEDGLRLVRERGRLMHEAGELHPGAMAAVLGLDVEVVRSICARAVEQTGGVLVVANDNCPGQVVISGDRDTLNAGLTLAKAEGARRTLMLAVSIAAHSPLMSPVAEAFAQVLNHINFFPPVITIYGNLTAASLPDIHSIQQELRMQLTGPVRWTESVRMMIADGVERFFEIGPGSVLTGLIRRIDTSLPVLAISDTASLHMVGAN